MRKLPVAVLSALSVLVLAACGRVAPQDPEPLPPDVLFLRSTRGITLVDSLSGVAAVRLSDAVPSTDFRTVVQGLRNGVDLEISAFDVASGDELWSRHVSGNLEVKVASTDGRLVALGPPSADYAGYPRGRSTTELVVLDQETAQPRTIQLDGNYAPEAFSTDGRSLFVVEYLPPENPDSYRVRRLDLVTEEVVGVYTVDQELQERMRGTARIQAASPDGRRLYTLYTLKDDDGSMHSFVHVLALDELWAHCVDLPSSFGVNAERAMTLTVTPDGSRLYAADGSTNGIAEIDTQALTVARTAVVDFGTRRAPAQAAYGANGVLYLASGTDVVAIDTSTLAEIDSWYYGDRITGLQAGSDGRRLFVGLPDRIAVIDTATGAKLPTLEPERIGTIDQLGQSTRTVAEERTVVSCAC